MHEETGALLDKQIHLDNGFPTRFLVLTKPAAIHSWYCGAIRTSFEKMAGLILSKAYGAALRLHPIGCNWSLSIEEGTGETLVCAGPTLS